MPCNVGSIFIRYLYTFRVGAPFHLLLKRSKEAFHNEIFLCSSGMAPRRGLYVALAQVSLITKVKGRVRANKGCAEDRAVLCLRSPYETVLAVLLCGRDPAALMFVADVSRGRPKRTAPRPISIRNSRDKLSASGCASPAVPFSIQ